MNLKNDFEKLKEKFENLMKTMQQIKANIEQQDKQIQETQEKQKNLKNKNDKYFQNQRLLQLEEDIKKYSNENKDLEKDIENLVQDKMKKDSDIHQIKQSIINIHDKVMLSLGKKIDGKWEDDDSKLCNKLDDINSRIIDLIKILEKMEKLPSQNNDKNK